MNIDKIKSSNNISDICQYVDDYYIKHNIYYFKSIFTNTYKYIEFTEKKYYIVKNDLDIFYGAVSQLKLTYSYAKHIAFFKNILWEK